MSINIKTEEGLKKVVGAYKGGDGFSPVISENSENSDTIYKLDITDVNGTFTTPNLKGGSSTSGESSGDENVIESISVNGTALTPDGDKNVDITIPEGYDDTDLAGRVTDLETGIADKADKTELHSHDNKATLDGVTDAKVAEWDAKATEAFVTNAIAQAQLDGSEVDLSGLATKDELAAKADSTHTHTLADVTDYEAPDLSGYAKTEDIPDVSNFVEKEEGKGLFSGSYNDLTDKPEIPTTDGFVTEESLNTTLADYAKTEDLPSGYDDTALVERVGNVETALVDKADADDIPDVSNFVEKEEGKGLFSGSYNDLIDQPTIPSIEGLVTEESLNTTLADYAKTEDIPDVSNFVEKEEGKGLFSGSYNDLIDQPTIPSIEGLVTEESLNTTLADYAKTEDIPEGYDDTELSNRVTATEEAITTLNGSGEGSVTKAVNDALNEFATNISNDGIVNTYKELIDYAASHSSDVAEMVGDIEANTTAIDGLDGRVETLETNLGSHTVKSDVPADAKFTDTTDFLPLAGGSMDTNAEVNFSGDRGTTTIKGGVIESNGSVKALDIMASCIYSETGQPGGVIDVYASLLIPEADISSLTVNELSVSKTINADINGHATTATVATKLDNTSSIGTTYKPVFFNAEGVPEACTYTLSKSVPSSAVFTDTKNTAGSTNSTSKLFLIGATTQAVNPQTYSNSNCYISGNNMYSNGRKCITSYVDDGTIIQMCNSTDNSYIRPSSVDFLHYDEGYDVEVSAGIEYNRVYLSNDDGTTTIEYTPYGINSAGSSYTLNLYDDTKHYDMGYDAFSAHAADGTKFNLGISSCPWKQLYATTSTIATSDRNEKMDIADLDDALTKDFVMSLKPSSYKFINNDSNRTHYGMISQDVEETMNSLGMDSLDFAGFIKSPKMVTSEETGKLVEVEGEYTYGLRYEEFIAPMIKMIQMQQKEIEELKSAVAKLSNKAQ